MLKSVRLSTDFPIDEDPRRASVKARRGVYGRSERGFPRRSGCPRSPSGSAARQREPLHRARAPPRRDPTVFNNPGEMEERGGLDRRLGSCGLLTGVRQ